MKLNLVFILSFLSFSLNAADADNINFADMSDSDFIAYCNSDDRNKMLAHLYELSEKGDGLALFAELSAFLRHGEEYRGGDNKGLTYVVKNSGDQINARVARTGGRFGTITMIFGLKRTGEFYGDAAATLSCKNSADEFNLVVNAVLVTAIQTAQQRLVRAK